MSRNLLTYKELASALKLAPGTVRNIWRSYPYICVTPVSGEKPNLRGVRFILEDVLAYLLSHSHFGGQYGYQENQNQDGYAVRGVLQISGQTDIQEVHPQNRRCNLGGRGKEASQKAGNTALTFNVFDPNE